MQFPHPIRRVRAFVAYIRTCLTNLFTLEERILAMEAQTIARLSAQISEHLTAELAVIRNTAEQAIVASTTAAKRDVDSMHDRVIEAARSVMIAGRRTCGSCQRLVHSFHVNAGLATCSDCIGAAMAQQQRGR